METPDGLVDSCHWCDGPIQVQIFKGTGICSENCRKELGVWSQHVKDHCNKLSNKEEQ